MTDDRMTLVTTYIPKYGCYIKDVPHYRRAPDYWAANGQAGPIAADVVEMMDWLQFCLLEVEAGHENRMTPDPLYRRYNGRPPMTPEEIDKVIDGIDEEFAEEMDKHGSTHYSASGAKIKPEFSRFGPAAKRFLVEGCDQIIHKWDVWFTNQIEKTKMTGEFWIANPDKARE